MALQLSGLSPCGLIVKEAVAAAERERAAHVKEAAAAASAERESSCATTSQSAGGRSGAARAVLLPIDNVGDISNLVPRHTPGGKPRVSVGSKFSQGLCPTQIPVPDPLEEEKSFSADSSDSRVVAPLLGNVLRS